MDYESFFKERLDALRSEGRYRVFADLERRCGRFPRAFDHRIGAEVTVWCSNDYLGMGQHPAVVAAIEEALPAAAPPEKRRAKVPLDRPGGLASLTGYLEREAQPQYSVLGAHLDIGAGGVLERFELAVAGVTRRHLAAGILGDPALP
jgi:7-keto-8-aminopelargonate synthetase-like enzyme